MCLCEDWTGSARSSVHTMSQRKVDVISSSLPKTVPVSCGLLPVLLVVDSAALPPMPRTLPGGSQPPMTTHAKLLKMTLCGVTRCSPPPYSCTRVRTFRPLSGPGVMSDTAPSAPDLHTAHTAAT